MESTDETSKKPSVDDLDMDIIIKGAFGRLLSHLEVEDNELSACVDRVRNYIVTHLEDVLSSTVHILINEGVLKDELESNNLPDESIGAVVDSSVSQCRLKIEDRLGVKREEFDLVNIDQHYEYLKDIWKSAKREAIKAQADRLKSEKWRQRVNAYEVDLPDDLIEWLNKSDAEKREILAARTDLPHLKARLRDGYNLSKPSAIALEHAARLCGAPPYYYSIARLWELYRKHARIHALQERYAFSLKHNSD